MAGVATHRNRPRLLASGLAGTAAVLVRRARTDLPVLAALAAVIVLTAGTAAALPRHLQRTADAGIRYLLDRAPAASADVLALQAGVIPPGPGSEPLAGVAARGAEFGESLPGPVRGLVRHQDLLLTSAKYVIPNDPPEQDEAILRDITLRYQSGLEPHIRLVQGRMPAPTDELGDLRGTILPVVEVAVSTSAAENLLVDVDERLAASPDLSVMRSLRVAFRDLRPIQVRVVGVFDVADPDDPYWAGDPRLARPRVYLDGDWTHVEAFGLIAPEAYGDVLAATAPIPLQYTWRYRLDTSQVTAGDADGLRRAVRRLESEYGSGPPTELRVQTGLSAVFDRYRTARTVSVAMLTVAGAGLAGVLLALLVLTGALGTQRRRHTLDLLRARGASTGQILSAQAVEGLLVAVPAGVLGAVLAAILVPAAGWRVPALLVAAVAAASVALLVAAAHRLARSRLVASPRPDAPPTGPSPRRLVVEALVIGAAVLGVVLLRRRGLSGAAGVDPFLAAAPVLVGLAAGLLTLRLYPAAVGAVAPLAARRRGLVASLGLRRSGRDPRAAAGTLLVVLLAVAVATFASVTGTTVEQGRRAATWHAVAADYRVDAAPRGTIHSQVDLTSVEGVTGLAAAHHDPGVQLAGEGRSVELLAVDAPAYRDVTAGTPAAPDLPPVLAVEAGDPGASLPAVVGGTWSGGTPRVGDQLNVRVGGDQLSLTAVATAERFAGIAADRPFVVVDLAAARAGTSAALPATRLYLRGSAGAAEPLLEAVEEQIPSASVLDRAAREAELAGSPFVDAVLDGLRIATALSVAAAVAAVLLGLVLTARARQRDLAVLRAVGLSPRQTVRLALVEIVPPVAVALVAGLALGLATVHVTVPALDLAPFIGPELPVAVVADGGAAAALAAALAAATVVAVVGVAIVTRRADLDRVLRFDQEVTT